MDEIIKSSAQKLGQYSALKVEQLKVVSQFVSGKDVVRRVAHWLWQKPLFCHSLSSFVFDSIQDHNGACVS